MKRFGYNVTPPKPLELGCKQRRRGIPHICLLAITIDDLPFEHIWKHWANGGSNSSSSLSQQPQDSTDDGAGVIVSLVCHAKVPDRVQSPWLRQRLLLEPPRRGRGTTYDEPVYRTHRPAWGSVEITRAMRDCLATASQIGAATAVTMKHEGKTDDTAAAAVATSATSNNNHNDGEQEAADPRFDPNRFVISKPDVADAAITLGATSTTSTIPPVDKFIFISETCLPVRSLKECRDILFPPSHRGDAATTVDGAFEQHDAAPAAAAAAAKPSTSTATIATKTRAGGTVAAAATAAVDPWDVSWLNARNRKMEGTPRNLYERDQFANIHRMIPGACRWKADQWLVLSRKHAEAVLHMDRHMLRPQDQLWNAFANVNASDEMYFPTALGVLGILRDDENENNTNNALSAAATTANPEADQTTTAETKVQATAAAAASEVEKRAVTYTDWTEGMRNPSTFPAALREFRKIASAARQQGCLLARKFVAVVPGAADAVHSSSATTTLSVDEWDDTIQKLGMAEQQKKDQ